MHRADKIKILELRVKRLLAKKVIKQKDIDDSNKFIDEWKQLTKYKET
jgi:hypothetical protein